MKIKSICSIFISQAKYATYNNIFVHSSSIKHYLCYKTMCRTIRQEYTDGWQQWWMMRLESQWTYCGTWNSWRSLQLMAGRAPHKSITKFRSVRAVMFSIVAAASDNPLRFSRSAKLLPFWRRCWYDLMNWNEVTKNVKINSAALWELVCVRNCPNKFILFCIVIFVLYVSNEVLLLRAKLYVSATRTFFLVCGSYKTKPAHCVLY